METAPNGLLTPSKLSPALRSPRSHPTTSGMTLFEIMMAMAVLTIASMSLMAAALAARRLAQNNLLAMSAQVCAQGYMEQLKGVGYGKLAEASISTRLTASSDALDTLVPHTALDIWPAETDRTGPNSKLLDIRNVPGGGGDLLVQLNPVISAPLATDADLKYYVLTVQYRWQATDLANVSGVRHWRTNTLTSIRSAVQAY